MLVFRLGARFSTGRHFPPILLCRTRRGRHCSRVRHSRIGGRVERLERKRLLPGARGTASVEGRQQGKPTHVRSSRTRLRGRSRCSATGSPVRPGAMRKVRRCRVARSERSRANVSNLVLDGGLVQRITANGARVGADIPAPPEGGNECEDFKPLSRGTHSRF